MTAKIGSLAGLAMLLTAIAAGGQVSQRAHVTVPFSFVAAGTSSPAGDYKVDVDNDRHLVTLSSDASKSIRFLTISGSPSSDGRTYLRFHQYGEHWFLERVSINGEAQEVPIAKRVKEVFTASNTVDGGALSADIALH